MKSNQEQYKEQRGKEKRELFKRFKIRAIEDVYKKKFFNLFDNRCFKCGTKEKPYVEIGPPVLCIDHHIPLIHGGHLVPGNLVSLCHRCNNKKHDRRPEEFYSAEELNKLKPILEKQNEIFEFNFDLDRWENDREGYLLSIGVEKQLVHELLYNQDHRDYVGLPSEGLKIAITIDINDIISNIIKQ